MWSCTEPAPPASPDLESFRRRSPAERPSLGPGFDRPAALDRQETPGSAVPPKPGVVFCDGRVGGHGQDLDMEPGRLILAGPPLDAALGVTDATLGRSAEGLAQDGTRQESVSPVRRWCRPSD